VIKLHKQCCDPQLMHTTPVHQLTSCELNTVLCLLSIILLSPVKKVILSESGEKYAKVKLHEKAKTVLNKHEGGF